MVKPFLHGLFSEVRSVGMSQVHKNFHVSVSDQMDFISELRNIATDEDLDNFKKKVVNKLISCRKKVLDCPFCAVSFTASKNLYAHVRQSCKVIKGQKPTQVETVEKQERVELEELLDSSNPCEGMLQSILKGFIL